MLDLLFNRRTFAKPIKLASILPLIAGAIWLVPVTLSGQKETPRTAQEAIEAQEAAQKERIAEANRAWEAGRKRHWNNQDRLTQKRMRRSYRESQRLARGRNTPWWQRVLRGGR